MIHSSSKKRFTEIEYLKNIFSIGSYKTNGKILDEAGVRIFQTRKKGFIRRKTLALKYLEKLKLKTKDSIENIAIRIAVLDDIRVLKILRKQAAKQEQKILKLRQKRAIYSKQYRLRKKANKIIPLRMHDHKKEIINESRSSSPRRRNNSKHSK